MSAGLLPQLVQMACASSAAILVVGAVRVWLRRWAGAELAYWLWLLVPCSALAVVVPLAESGASMVTEIAVLATPAMLTERWVRSSEVVTRFAHVLWIWGLGSAGILTWLLLQQRRFEHSLGELRQAPDGTYRSEHAVAPLLLGILRPRIVLPADFESLYDAEQRALVIAHEQAHRRRGDPIANALAVLMLCLFWFNPLLYWALARLRFDQDLACDASVLASAGNVRRQYAEALLVTQLAGDAAWLRIGSCHWGSNHPLQERIAMIKSPLPSRVRRWMGKVFASGVILACSFSAWATQVDRPQDSLFQVTAERVDYAAGVYRYSGNVVVTAPARLPYKVTSEVIERWPDGTLVASGDVHIEMGLSTLYSTHAVIHEDGIIELDQVEVTYSAEY